MQIIGRVVVLLAASLAMEFVRSEIEVLNSRVAELQAQVKDVSASMVVLEHREILREAGVGKTKGAGE